jgi:hypothetical protein
VASSVHVGWDRSRRGFPFDAFARLNRSYDVKRPGQLSGLLRLQESLHGLSAPPLAFGGERRQILAWRCRRCNDAINLINLVNLVDL